MEEVIDKVLDGLVEGLAEIEHRRWAHWQKYMHGKALRLSDGSLILPAEFVARWEEQIRTDYGNLEEKEKESDREQVRRYLPLIAEALKATVLPGT